MTDPTDAALSALPARLRATRRAQGLSLDAVAKLSGVSRSMVSQIERGESSPTIATLWNLTRALQVDFAGLLDLPAKPAAIDVTPAGQAPRIDGHGHGCRIQILSPPEDAGRHKLYQLDFAKGGVLDSAAHRTGAREQLIVLEGQMEIRSGDGHAQVAAGDTARYAADVPHCLSAVSGPARALLVVHNA